MERILPDKGVTLGGNMNQPQSRTIQEESMLITIMPNVGFATPYTADIIIISQNLPQYFNQPYAADFGHQILIGLGTNFVRYGLASLTRPFLVFPSYCVWPTSLVTIALNKAFHSEPNITVPGPFGRVYTWSRMRTLTVCIAAMFA
jgi:hypothetical protein